MEVNKVGGRWQEMQEWQDRVEREGTGKRLKIRNHQEEVNQGNDMGYSEGKTLRQAKVRVWQPGGECCHSQREEAE